MSRMKQLAVTMEGVEDSTGYLFSFAKSLSAALRNSPYRAYGEDIVATSGFSFRMWVAADCQITSPGRLKRLANCRKVWYSC